MELSDALEKAKQVLEEERSAPTVRYVRRHSEGTASVETVFASQELQEGDPRRKRKILEGLYRLAFESVNYSLLCALNLQIAEESRSAFVHNIVLFMNLPPACGRPIPGSPGMTFPSELPLVAEFAARNGGKYYFFSSLAEAVPLPGHVSLMRHLQDMIALNFTVFSDADYDRLAFSVGTFGERARITIDSQRGGRIPPVRFPIIGSTHPSMYCVEITESAQAIKELCRKAKYLYLKGALLEGLNLEVNQDKDTVVSYLKELGFSDALVGSLSEADRLYHGPANAFELKSSMGHLRSFMENLLAEAIPTIVAKGVPAPASGWGSGLAFLRQNNVLTHKEEQLAASLYGLISGEAVHPLIAEREYARLARNMVIEYALLFLRKMHKLGLKRA